MIKALRVFKNITVMSVYVTAVFFSIFTVCAISDISDISDDKPKRLFDEAALFSDFEYERLNDLLCETEEKTGFYVALLTTNDVGYDKSDSGVVDYADLYYEKNFGIDTDGIIFVINNDTKYDYISTSGICIRYFTDDRISRILDKTYDYLVDGDYNGAGKAFCEQVSYYGGLGIPSNQYNEYEGKRDYFNDNYNDYDNDGLIVINGYKMEPGILAVGFVVSVIICVMIIITVRSRYRIKPAKNAVNYLDKSSVRYRQKTDTFIRQYVTKRKIESSSGGGGGGSGRSSVHRSSGGGSHGGGGRHR